MLKYLLILATVYAGDPDLRAEMHERFTRATMIQTALINGDPEDARHWAVQLAALAPESDGFADIRSRFGHLAKQVAEASTLEEAAQATGQLADACGSCHQLFGVQHYRFESAIPVPAGDALPQRMARHGWAVDRMWEALVGRLESSWAAGAATLLEAPLGQDQFNNGDRVRQLANRVREVGSEAVSAVQWSRRAGIYGKLLATCADCHKSYRDR